MVSTAETIRRPQNGTELSDPFARLLAADERGSQRFWVSFVLTVALYVALGVRGLVMSTGLGGFAESVLAILQKSHHAEFEIEPPPPPPPPQPTTPEPEPEVPKEAPPPRAAPAPAAPPAAAEAGKVLTADPDPDEPVDLTGNGFVQGTGDTFAGGVTTSDGTSRTAVRNLQAAGSATAVGTEKVAPKDNGRDLSRKAAPLSGNWDDCGFPPEADIEQINNASVALVVTVDADGHATNATVTRDPGYGFGSLAKRCALRKRYTPPLNKAGEPATITQPVTINFVR